MRSDADGQIRVVVADDHPSIRENLRYLLNAEPDMRVVGVASDGAEALRVTSDELPDVLVVDHDMPGLDGLVVMRRLRVDHPGIAVVLYTAEPEICDDAINAGAAGCVGKDDSPALLLETIRNAAVGLALGDLRRSAAGALPRMAPLEVEALARAVERDEIEAHLQPLVELRGGRLSRVELLSRWRHPGGRAMPPEAFIALAEEHALITPLTVGVVARAVRDLDRLRDTWPDLHLNVNLSVASLLDERFFDQLLMELGAAGCDPSRIAIEITESVLVREPAVTAGALRRLREVGIRIEVDDFGTGYSSLGRLVDLPIDVVKVDRRFVSAMTRDHRSEAIVRACIGLAHDLGLEVVAEGVEDRETWELLRDIGCDTAQGYYVGAAMPLDDLTPWLSGWRRRVPAAVAKRERGIAVAGRQVLVVDDEPAIVAMIRDVLEDAGFEVITAANGVEALRAIEHIEPAVVLLDMQMPILDGAGFARLLRERGMRVPIVVMTAGSSAERWARELPADAHLAKPFDIEGLLGVARRYAGVN